MNQRETITRAVLDAIRDTNALLPPGRTLEVSENAVLLGSDGLDSLGLVNLLVAVENRSRAATGRSVSLADSLAEPPERSPFRSVPSLVGYIEQQLETGA